ncbi:MAG: multiubiquitin domain-containing protein [Gammaproteobacteria bacterium]|nr:multiubiquitin domain-containing protein [Gammaproteobacteria bacterium]
MNDRQRPNDKPDAPAEQHLDKTIGIVVNGTPKRTELESLTFDQVVALAFPDPPTGKYICFTITYRGAGGRKPEGSLIEGGSVKIKEGTVFNVTVTDKS